MLADTDTLMTLDDRQLSSGLAEVIKYGLINDIDFFEWLEEHIEALVARDPFVLAEAIERSCQDKANIVAGDEREQGVRAILNLGHTFGHAIETGMGYGEIIHGEAVAIGMVMAADLSMRHGWLAESDVVRAKKLLLAAGLPIDTPEGMTSEMFMKLMSVDKKVQSGVIRLVLLKQLGQAFISDDYESTMLAQTLAHFEHG